MLCGQYYSNNEARQRYHKKTREEFLSLRQKFSTYQQREFSNAWHTPYRDEIYSRHARLVHHFLKNQYNPPHQHAKEKISYGHINWLRKKNLKISNTHSWLKTHSKLGREAIHLNLIISIHSSQKSLLHLTSYLMVKKHLNAFHLRQRTKQGCLLSPLSF